jgi:hypothetical protein
MKKILFVLCVILLSCSKERKVIELRLDQGYEVDVWTHCYKDKVSQGITYQGKKYPGWSLIERDLKRGYTYKITCSAVGKKSAVSIYYNNIQQSTGQSEATFKYK